MISERRALRHGRDLSWAQVLMAANTPMLLRAGLVEDRMECWPPGRSSGCWTTYPIALRRGFQLACTRPKSSW